MQLLVKCLYMLLITTYKMSHNSKTYFHEMLIVSPGELSNMKKGERAANATPLLFNHHPLPFFLFIEKVLSLQYDHLHFLSNRSTFNNDATCQYHEKPSFILIFWQL